MLVPERTIRRLRTMPLDLRDSVLKLAMVDSGNLEALDDVRRLVKGVRIQPLFITPDHFVKLLNTAFATPAPSPGKTAEALSDIVDEMFDVIETEEDWQPNGQELERASSDTPIVRMGNSILLSARQKKASDIHIEPQDNRIKVRYRIDGSMQLQDALPKQLSLALISRFKLMAHTRWPTSPRCRPSLKSA